MKRGRIFTFKRFGFEDIHYTLQEIGDYMGVCRERVRQIEKDALKQLRRRLEGKEWIRHLF